LTVHTPPIARLVSPVPSQESRVMPPQSSSTSVRSAVQSPIPQRQLPLTPTLPQDMVLLLPEHVPLPSSPPSRAGTPQLSPMLETEHLMPPLSDVNSTSPSVTLCTPVTIPRRSERIVNMNTEQKPCRFCQ
jgi:hypothetical protein